PASTDTEAKLVQIWQELLGADRVGVNDNFFELGGHSLLAIQLSSKIKHRFSIKDFPIVHIFKNPTIRQLAGVIAEIAITRDKNQTSHLLLLQPHGNDSPIFIVPGTFGISDAYYELAGAFGTDQPVYGLHMQGVLEGEHPLESIEEIAGKNLEWIRTVQPEGPYKLVGHSLGGIVVYEMIRQLEEKQELIDMAVLLDSNPENKTNDEEKRDQMAFLIQHVLQSLPEARHAAICWDLVRKELPVSSFEDLNSYVKNMLKENSIVLKNTDLLERLFRIIFVNLHIAYRPQKKIRQKLILVKAQESNWDAYDLSLGWAKWAEIHVTTAPGGHHSMLERENAKCIVEEVRNALRMAKWGSQPIAVETSPESVL
ncbi:MAG TPA: alpha/beta fold hydrolase, partial [Segetibacter sp.]